MRTLLSIPAGICFLLLICSSATSGEKTSAPQQQYFDIYVDPWMSLHHFAYHASRSLSGAKLRGVVALDANDRALLEHEVADEFAPLAQTYAPYLRQSILFSPETRSVARALRVGPRLIMDENLRRQLQAFMPVYETYFWPRHRELGTRFAKSLSTQLENYGPQMVARLTRYLERDWPDQPVRVDIVPYANWAGAYTDDNPPHITLGSNDPDITRFAFEMVFHEASHTRPLIDSIELAAKQGLNKAGLESDRFWHYLLFYVSGRAAAEALDDTTYLPYAQATGKTSQPGAVEFYKALESTWDLYDSLAERAEAAAIEVAKSQVVEH